jgi:hypothetical protein
MDTTASMDPSERPPRQRPLIYIYELPADYNVRLMQYRIEVGGYRGRCRIEVPAAAARGWRCRAAQAVGGAPAPPCGGALAVTPRLVCSLPAPPQKKHCTWRHWLPHNDTAYTQWTYSIEPLLLEMLLASPHRCAPRSAHLLPLP